QGWGDRSGARLRPALGHLQRRVRSLDDAAGVERLAASHRRHAADRKSTSPTLGNCPTSAIRPAPRRRSAPPARRCDRARVSPRAATTRPGVPAHKAPCFRRASSADPDPMGQIDLAFKSLASWRPTSLRRARGMVYAAAALLALAAPGAVLADKIS